jgi:hypothetical protein
MGDGAQPPIPNPPIPNPQSPFIKYNLNEEKQIYKYK